MNFTAPRRRASSQRHATWRGIRKVFGCVLTLSYFVNFHHRLQIQRLQRRSISHTYPLPYYTDLQIHNFILLLRLAFRL